MKTKWVLFGLLCATLCAGGARASSVVGLSIEDQARLSELVVIGEVATQRGVRHPVNGIESAITLTVIEVLKGPARPHQALVFHSRSGEVDGEISEALGEARFRPGQKVLVFIESVEGRRYNLGLSMGVWNVHEDAAGGMTFTRALEDGLDVVGEEAVEPGPIGYDDLRARIADAARSRRFDNEMLRQRAGQGR